MNSIKPFTPYSVQVSSTNLNFCIILSPNSYPMHRQTFANCITLYTFHWIIWKQINANVFTQSKSRLNTSCCMRVNILSTRNKSCNASFEALQYRQDLLHFTTREHTSLSIHVVQKITIKRADKIRKSAV